MTTVFSAVALPAALLVGLGIGYRAGWHDYQRRQLALAYTIVGAVLEDLHDEARARATMSVVPANGGRIFDFDQHQGPFGGAA